MLAAKPLWFKEKRAVKTGLTLPCADASGPIETSRSRLRGVASVAGIRRVNKLTNLRHKGLVGAPRPKPGAVQVRSVAAYKLRGRVFAGMRLFPARSTQPLH